MVNGRADIIRHFIATSHVNLVEFRPSFPKSGSCLDQKLHPSAPHNSLKKVMTAKGSATGRDQTTFLDLCRQNLLDLCCLLSYCSKVPEFCRSHPTSPLLGKQSWLAVLLKMFRISGTPNNCSLPWKVIIIVNLSTFSNPVSAGSSFPSQCNANSWHFRLGKFLLYFCVSSKLFSKMLERSVIYYPVFSITPERPLQ